MPSFLHHGFCSWTATAMGAFFLGYSFTSSQHHNTHTKKKKSVQLSLVPLHWHNIQFLGHSIDNMVDHCSYKETQGNSEHYTTCEETKDSD